MTDCEPDEEAYRDRLDSALKFMSKATRGLVASEQGHEYGRLVQSADDFDRDTMPDFIREERHSAGLNSYACQYFFNTVRDVAANGLDAEQVHERLQEREASEMPSHLPSDGSKGQWTVAKKNHCKSYRWLLGGDE